MRTLMLFILFLSMLINFSCDKEYSFEGGGNPPPRDTITPPPPPPPPFPVCPACTNVTEPALDEWSFKSGGWKLCGTADSAIALGNRTAFTFFGPSACSVDTGMAITIYLNTDTLNRDLHNLTNNRAAFYCYERVTPSYIFMSQSSSNFSATITMYDHASHTISGTFSGNVMRTNGSGAGVESGKFKVKLY
ncbi:MAG: hypothetical protein NTW29_03985 [Bacteroidetes bacterium]|nr:hypothetical protein [Bacteroidota bacterium]